MSASCDSADKLSITLVKDIIHNTFTDQPVSTPGDLPEKADVLIVGGGLIGASSAYWIKTCMPNASVVVIEKDMIYNKSSTTLSVGSYRQQFSLPENIKLSMAGIDFLMDAHNLLKIDENDMVDFKIYHDGFLFLASPKTSDCLTKCHTIQRELGAQVRLLDPEALKKHFEWMNTEGVEVGSFGFRNEGWVDPRKYLLAIRRKALALGAIFVEGEVTSMDDPTDTEPKQGIQPKHTAMVTLPDNRVIPVKFETMVNAAGAWAGSLARMWGIGHNPENKKFETVPQTPEDIMTVPLPVEPRKRFIFTFHAPNGPVLDTLAIDCTGVFFLRHPSNIPDYYICGRNQSPAEDPKDLSLDKIEYEYFDNVIKPALIHRCPAFANLRLVSAYAGYYEVNPLDQNLIIDRHPVHKNLIFTNGSSGHGFQHSVAIGRAVSELIAHNEFKTIDLTRFGFDRIIKGEAVKESAII